MLEMVQNISNMAQIHYIRQKEAKGLGHAIFVPKHSLGMNHLLSYLEMTSS